MSPFFVAVTVSEALEVAERVCVSDHAVRIEAFDLISTPHCPPIRVSSWIPGSVVPPNKVSADFLVGLTALSAFPHCEKSAREATEELRNMYPSDDPNDVVPAAVPAVIDTAKEFITTTSNNRRLLAPNPKIFSQLFSMNKKQFEQVYRDFMYELHEEGHQRDKFPGNIEFDRFNTPYFDGYFTLLLPSSMHGPRLLQAIDIDSPSTPTVHSLSNGQGRLLAACLQTLWIEREKESKERLLWHLAKHGEVLTASDHELLSFWMELAKLLVLWWWLGG